MALSPVARTLSQSISLPMLQRCGTAPDLNILKHAMATQSTRHNVDGSSEFGTRSPNHSAYALMDAHRILAACEYAGGPPPVAAKESSGRASRILAACDDAGDPPPSSPGFRRAATAAGGQRPPLQQPSGAFGATAPSPWFQRRRSRKNVVSRSGLRMSRVDAGALRPGTRSGDGCYRGPCERCKACGGPSERFALSPNNSNEIAVQTDFVFTDHMQVFQPRVPDWHKVPPQCATIGVQTDDFAVLQCSSSVQTEPAAEECSNIGVQTDTRAISDIAIQAVPLGTEVHVQAVVNICDASTGPEEEMISAFQRQGSRRSVTTVRTQTEKVQGVMQSTQTSPRGSGSPPKLSRSAEALEMLQKVSRSSSSSSVGSSHPSPGKWARRIDPAETAAWGLNLRAAAVAAASSSTPQMQHPPGADLVAAAAVTQPPHEHGLLAPSAASFIKEGPSFHTLKTRTLGIWREDVKEDLRWDRGRLQEDGEDLIITGSSAEDLRRQRSAATKCKVGSKSSLHR